jgi:hypothetical protein
VATRGDDDSGPSLATGTSTSAPDTSIPTFESTTTAVATVPSIDPVSTTVAGVTTTGAAGGPPTAGVLEPDLTTLLLPKVDATVGAARGAVTLRNTGSAPLTYTAQSSSPGLSAVPARATIGPGGSAAVSVTLDGTRVDTEGPFTGTLSFVANGASKAVQVQSVVGSPPQFADNVGEPCPLPTTLCSRQIKLAPSAEPSPSPCNTPWLYSITIADQSRIQTARVIARRGTGNDDTLLQRAGGNIFQSNPYKALDPGTVLRFSIEAVDEHGFGLRLPEQTIACA